jgi:hypothetical protein
VTAGTGQYGGSNCTALGGEKKYEWFPASASAKPLVKSRFTTKLKEKTEAKLLTSGGKLISCTGESGTGEYTGRKSLGNVALTFTGCQLAGAGPCESSGAAAGEVHTVALEGTLGLIKASVEGPAKNTIGTALKPATGELVAAFSCNGTPVTVKGSVIGEVKRNAMTTKAPIKFAQAKAIQKPVRFEGGEEDVLTAAFGEGAPFERTGLAMITNKTDEERIEANSVF